ncbi:MAG: MarR family transcriptional regulator [Pseudomonadota bacterium]
MTRFVDDYLLYLLAQASGTASAAFHARIEAEGVPVATWRILATLYPDAPASLGDLARACMTKQPTMTRQIDRLAEKGLVHRETEPGGDRRRVVVRLTEEGRTLAAHLVTLAEAHEADLLSRTGARDMERLKKVLRAVIETEREHAE